MVRFVAFILVAMLLLLLASVSAAPDYDTIVEKGSLHMVSSDEKNHLLYTLSPDSVIEEHEASISTVAFINTSRNDNISLQLLDQERAKPIEMNEFVADDTPENETYYLTSWNITPEANTTYSLRLSINDRTVHQTDVFVEVKERSIVDRNVRETALDISKTALDDQVEKKVRLLLSDAGYSFTPLEFENLKNNARMLLDTRKTLTTRTVWYDDNTSKTTTTVNLSIEPKPDAKIKNVKLIEVVPKSVANDTDQLSFKDDVPEILEKDPVIMWNMEDLEDQQGATYEVEDESDVTGNTIVLAEEKKNTGKNAFFKILLAIILIPLIVGLIIYFNRYAPEQRTK
ncbi:MAG: hypothetical protein ACLFTH_00185 [Candidatus Woesearchaeota archaeon]